ncbi:MAG: SNF2-related protein [Actinomycetota bacterium]
MTATPAPAAPVASIDRDNLDRIVQQYLDNRISDVDEDFLEANHPLWVDSLWRLLEQADVALEHARQNVKGPERASVLNDLEDECERIDDLITDLVGPVEVKGPDPDAVVTGTAQLQLSWSRGQILAWTGGHAAEPGTLDELKTMLERHDGGSISWLDSDPIDIASRGEAPALASPIISALGWIIGFGNTPADDDSLGTSARWFGLAAAFAVELVAQGRMVPLLEQFRGGRRGGKGGLGTYHVRWAASVMDRKRLDALADAAPGAAMAASDRKDRKEFAGAVVADLTDAITRIAAGQIEMPAAPDQPSTKNDVGEAIMSRLDGSAFQAPHAIGNDVVQRMGRWAQSVTGSANMRLQVKLNPPDEDNAWLAEVLAPGQRNGMEPVEVAMATASQTKSKTMGRQLQRLERLFPALLRPGGRRRGEVILSQDEAWQLMSETGTMLITAGFDVSVPSLAKRKATPTLRLTTESSETVVGAQQLADVRWSAVFDDVELTAAEIAALAAEARPMIKSQGEWIEIDKVDLAAAAAALAERADQNRMTGAEMLRHALGLEGNPFGGQMSIAGQGWAADLMRSLATLPEEPDTTPPGFEGELRSYQADAYTWLSFLDEAGMGGCLALDMGLGKTPTTLASLGPSREHGPGLVIAPPAVVGNWASEARKFMPDLRVLVHHGQNRRKADDFLAIVDNYDVVITTYGTAVRDIDILEKVEFGKAVIDEAQAIKNPAAETSRQLRRLNARTRLALTGTPIENGLGDLWAILDWANPGLLGPRASFISQLTPAKRSKEANEDALTALNGILVYRRTKAEPAIAAELPDRIDELDHCAMTPEQIGLYQAVINTLAAETAAADVGTPARKGAVLAAITALKQICNHPLNYNSDDENLDIEGRSGKIARLNEIIDTVFAAGERMLVFTHFASWGERLAAYLTERTQTEVNCYHGGLARGARDRMIDEFQSREGPGVLVLSLKAGGTGLNLTSANHVVLFDRWWNPAVEDQARDRVWRIGQKNTVICHRLVCPGTIDERVEEVVAGKREIANIVLPKSSSVGDLDAEQLQAALGLDPELLVDYEPRLAEPDPDDLAAVATGESDPVEVPA